MSAALGFLIYTLLAPAGVAFAAMWLAWKVLPTGPQVRWSSSAAVALGFATAFVLLHGAAAIVPQRHWQWLPYLGGLAAVLGATALARGVFAAERWVVFFALSLVAAWCLVPTWDTLAPPRLVWIGILTAYFTLLMGLVDALPPRLQSGHLLAAMMVTALAVALLVAAELSLVLGQLGGIVMAALAGCRLAGWRDPLATATRGLIPVFVILIGGVAFAAAIEPEPPVWGLLLAAAAPLVLWGLAALPGARWSGVKAAMVQMVLMAAWLGVAAALMVMRGGGEEW
jgi:hypothetical protein